MQLVSILRVFQVMAACFFLSRCGHQFSSVPKKTRIHKPYTITNSFGTFHIKPNQYLDLNESGLASFYGSAFHGKPTATGKTFNMNSYTAAHKTAHLPSVAIITYKNTSRIALLNDRGPFAKKRVLDCSQKLAQDLGFARTGVGHVKIKVLKEETLALKENGGHLSWDGSTPFPLVTQNTKHICHFHPSQGKTKITLPKTKANKVKVHIYKMRRGKKAKHISRTGNIIKIKKKVITAKTNTTSKKK